MKHYENVTLKGNNKKKKSQLSFMADVEDRLAKQTRVNERQTHTPMQSLNLYREQLKVPEATHETKSLGRIFNSI